MKKGVLILVVFFTSCLGSKKVVEKSNTSVSVEKTEVFKDSVANVERNLAISDKIITPISFTGDKFLDKNIDDFLQKINTEKQSGNNSYQLKYNREKRQLETNITVGETTNKEIATNTSSETEKSVEERINEYVYRRITQLPWYIWVALYFLFLDGKIGALLSNIPALKGATSVLSIFKLLKRKTI